MSDKSIESSDNSSFDIAALGTAMSKKEAISIAVTLNFSPSQKVKCSIRSSSKRVHVWNTLTPDQQRDFFIKYIKEVYVPLCDQIRVGFEFTKNLMLHAHIMLIIDDNVSMSDYWLQTTRVKVSQNGMVKLMFKDNRHKVITANYIHLAEQDVWDEYIVKDQNKVPYKIYTIADFKG